MSEEFKTYYEFLRKELDEYRGSYEDYIFYLPDLFKLLCDLLKTDLKKRDRIYIGCTLGYIVAPNDVIPDEVYGPAGYVDDVFLCCYVLSKIKERYGIKRLNKLWKGDKDLETVLEIAYKSSSKTVQLNHLKEDILKYVGLD